MKQIPWYWWFHLGINCFWSYTTMRMTTWTQIDGLLFWTPHIYLPLCARTFSTSYSAGTLQYHHGDCRCIYRVPRTRINKLWKPSINIPENQRIQLAETLVLLKGELFSSSDSNMDWEGWTARLESHVLCWFVRCLLMSALCILSLWDDYKEFEKLGWEGIKFGNIGRRDGGCY